MGNDRVVTVRLLKKPSQYILASCAYLANAVRASYDSIHQTGLLQRDTAQFGIVLPLLIGVALVIILLPTALRHTSSVVERVLVIVTGILLVLSIIGYLHALGILGASLPHEDIIFMTTSWLAAILAGVETLQVLRVNILTPNDYQQT